jgi:hypothetical protein
LFGDSHAVHLELNPVETGSAIKPANGNRPHAIDLASQISGDAYDRRRKHIAKGHLRCVDHQPWLGPRGAAITAVRSPTGDDKTDPTHIDPIDLQEVSRILRKPWI